MKLVAKFIFAFLISGSLWARAAGQDDAMQTMCSLLKDPKITGYTRTALEARCEDKAEGAYKIAVVGEQGIVRQYRDGKWVVLGTVDGINSKWIIQYNVEPGIVTFVSPNGQQKKSISLDAAQ